MPATFHTTSPAIWDRTQRQLSGPAKVVRYYVQTCRVRLSEGLFELPFGHLVHDTGLSETHARQGLGELDAAGLVSYDEEAEVVLDRTALLYAPLKNGVIKGTGEVKPDNRLTAAVRKFGQVPRTALRVEFYRLAREYSPDLADALVFAHRDLGEVDVDYSDVPFDPPDKRAPSEPLGSPSEGASREEQSRGEPDKRKSGGGGATPCHWCGQESLVEAGEVQVGPGEHPWCGWCEAAA